MSLLTLIAGALSTACKIAATVIKISGVLEVVKIVGRALCEIGQALGILPPDKSMEDIGDQVSQAEAAGITPDKYSSFEDYKKDIENFEVDPEKSKTLTTKDKIQKGLEYEALGFTLKYPGLPVEEIFKSVAQHYNYFTPERSKALAPYLSENVELIGDIANYMSGKEKDLDKIDSVFDVLTNIEKQVQPGISDSEAQKRITSIL